MGAPVGSFLNPLFSEIKLIEEKNPISAFAAIASEIGMMQSGLLELTSNTQFAQAGFSDFVHRMIPMGKLAHIEGVVNAVLYLSSSGSAMVTGHSLLVDGGWTAR